MLYKKQGAVAKFDFAQPLFRCLRIRKMQGAKSEAEGSILRYVTEAECRKQHSSLCIMTHRLAIWIYSNATKLEGTPTAVITGVCEHSPVLVL